MVWSYRMCNKVGDGHTVRLAWVIGAPCGNVQCDEVILVEVGRGGACVPARVPHKGAPSFNPRAQYVMHKPIFGMETPLRERSGGHTGTAPTVSFGGLRVGGFVCLLGKRCTRTNTIGVVLFSAQG